MSIDFKFKSDAHFETIELEGKAFISVADLRQIVTDRRLNGSAGAFGLKLSNAQTGQGGVPVRTARRQVMSPRAGARVTLAFTPTCVRVRAAEFLDDDGAVPAGTAVLIRRVPKSVVGAGSGPAAPANFSTVATAASSGSTTMSSASGLLHTGLPQPSWQPQNAGGLPEPSWQPQNAGGLPEPSWQPQNAGSMQAQTGSADDDERIKMMMAAAGAEWWGRA